MLYIGVQRHIRTLCPLVKIRKFATSSDPALYKMSKVTVRSVPEEDVVHIQLSYKYGEGKQREFNFARKPSEKIYLTIEKLKNSILTKSVPKKKKKKIEGQSDDAVIENPLNIRLFLNEMEASPDHSVAEAFVQGAELIIQDEKIKVEVNIPKINALRLPTIPLTGFPIFPDIDFEFGNLDLFSFQWGLVPTESISVRSSGKVECQGKIQKKGLSNEIAYTPTESDIGYHLALSCTPKDEYSRTGQMITAYSKMPVIEGPDKCIFEKRHELTGNQLSGCKFRFVTYNILADVYADTEYTRTVLYPYCKDVALTFDYRKILLMKELSGYNADIVCLQEVDQKHFLRFFLPRLEYLGYTGVLQCKAGTMKEGEAVFFRSSRYTLIEDHSIVLRDVLATDPNLSELVKKLKDHEELSAVIGDLGTILQVVILEDKDNPGKTLCVANTHLYFHPKADLVRLIQSIVCTNHLHSIMKSFHNIGKDITCIFCGDFNSAPKSFAHQFLTTDAMEGNKLSLPEKENCMKGMVWKNPFNFVSACGYPDYTNYVGNFHEHLDYIFIDPSSLQVDRVIPPPSHEEVTKFQGLPSLEYPSDHIAQICEFSWL